MSERLSHGAFKGGEHRLPVRVYYEDTDFSGFVYHANYLKFFERGRSEALRATGVAHRDLLDWNPPAALVVRRMELDFRIPAQIEDDLVVMTQFEAPRGARMIVRQTIERAGETLVEAKLEIALINLGGGARRIPADFGEKIARVLAPE